MAEFFDLRSTHNPHRWFLPVTTPVVVGRDNRAFLFGGMGMAAAIRAMELTCKRPVIWATAQYLSFASLGSTVDLDVWVPNAGKYTSQARVIGHVGDQEILTVNAALGARPSDVPADQWIAAPHAPPPEDCEVVDQDVDIPGSLKSRFEVRRVSGRIRTPDLKGRGEGRLALWFRPMEDHPIGSDILAIIADYVSSAISDAIGEPAGGNSLDNTIRFARLVPTDWVLADIQIESVQDGVFHGAMRLYSRDGVLMATASQSMILRLWRDRKKKED